MLFCVSSTMFARAYARYALSVFFYLRKSILPEYSCYELTSFFFSNVYIGAAVKTFLLELKGRGKVY